RVRLRSMFSFQGAILKLVRIAFSEAGIPSYQTALAFATLNVFQIAFGLIGRPVRFTGAGVLS
ncbi:hypothetical protein, partial [Cohnella caldifontis]|uniref:hypothetical protein n=1 Tax=Cohnella caldifontis TaxID=3027471 RepID=UPI0023ECB235